MERLSVCHERHLRLDSGLVVEEGCGRGHGLLTCGLRVVGHVLGGDAVQSVEPGGLIVPVRVRVVSGGGGRSHELVLRVDGVLVAGGGVVVRALRRLVNVAHHGLLVRGQDGTGQRLLQLLLLLPVLGAPVLEPDLHIERGMSDAAMQRGD